VRDGKGKVVEIVLDEVEIRAAADRLMRGVSLGEIARSWDEKGFTTATGGRWLGTKVYTTGKKVHKAPCPGVDNPTFKDCECPNKNNSPGAGTLVGQVMGQPRLAGMLVYKGEITGEGASPAILEPDVWRALAATLDRRSGAGQGRQKGYAGGGMRAGALLTGDDSPARCAACGSTLTTANVKLNGRRRDEKTRVYRCTRGCVAMRLDEVDREVLHRAAAAAAEANVRLLPGDQAPDVAPLKAREAELERDMDTWRDKLRAREVSAEFALPLVNDLERELAEVRRDIASADAVTVAAPGELRRIFREWEALDLGEQRANVSRLYERITLDRRYDDQDSDTERIVSRFADEWLPASATPAGQDIRGVRSVLNLMTGRMVVSDWLLVG
jgi:hypothetical protein